MSRGLAPVGPEKAKVLILGSFPSRKSLGAGEYYGHPRNHFWPILAEIARENGVGAPGAPRDWDGKVLLLDRLGVALWDLVASCERPGSLDADISGEILNPVADFVSRHPSIERVGLNGAAAAAFFSRHFAPETGLGSAAIGQVLPWILRTTGGLERRILLARLPSTSPIPTSRFRTTSDRLPWWSGFLRS
ncbi:MAG: DNA-deoxyinosine glycosylase [Spirochaetota bacterium]